MQATHRLSFPLNTATSFPMSMEMEQAVRLQATASQLTHSDRRQWCSMQT